MGPNFVLDKGFLATGTNQAYALGELVTLTGAGNSVARQTTAGSPVIGVCMENLDAVKQATGKALISVRVIGIARVLAAGAIAVGDRVGVTAAARAQTVARSAAGAQPALVFGIAMTASTANGDFVDVLLTPGDTY